MTINGGAGEDVDHFMAHIALEKRIVKLEEKAVANDRLAHNVGILAWQVQQLGLALGIAHKLPVPDEWAEITQVRRPELHSLRVRARRGPAAAGGGVAFVWVIVELLRAFADGRLRLPWH